MNRKKRSHTFTSRIFFYIAPWVAAIVILTSFISVMHLLLTFRKEKERTTEIIVSEKAEKFDSYFFEIKSTLAYVASMPEVESAFKYYFDMDLLEQYKLNQDIADKINGLNIFKNYLEDIIIIGENGYCKNMESFINLKSDTNPLEWECIQNYEPSGNSNYSFYLPYIADYYEDSPHKVCSVVLPVLAQKKAIGYVQANLNYDKLQKYFQNEISNVGAYIEVIDKNGKIIFAEDENITEKKIGQDYLSEMTQQKGRFSFKREKYGMVVYQKSELTEWIFCGLISYRTLLAPFYQAIRLQVFLVLPVSILVISLVIIFLSRRIKQPINRLLLRVAQADPEHYESVDICYGVKEVQILGDEFEEAMLRIHELIQYVYQAEIAKKNAEFEVLRNQITPHFMYNSLQLIKAEAVMSHNKDISKIVTALTNLLRYSMDTKADFVTVQEEMAYIGDYLELYKRRYVDKFTYEIQIEDQIKNCKIPKLILQPLVENSIRHGFENVKKNGNIRVIAKIQNQDGIFEVYDNGKGISKENVERLLREFQDTENPASGIGLYNVHQRIAMQYGSQYGIVKIESSEGMYTRIFIRIKLIWESEEEI